MTRAAEEILNEALQLPEEERDRIADTLWYSVHCKEDQSVEEAWIDEARYRLAEIDTGKVQLVPGEEVLPRLRARFGR